VLRCTTSCAAEDEVREGCDTQTKEEKEEEGKKSLPMSPLLQVVFLGILLLCQITYTDINTEASRYLRYHRNMPSLSLPVLKDMKDKKNEILE
jgi:hypothetical protein